MKLTYALFTTCFYRHNEKISARENKRPEYPIDEHKHLHVDETSEEKFGLPFRTVVEITGDVTLRAKLPTNPQYIETFALTSWNFRSVSTPGDGNCLFHSVVFALQQQLQQQNNSICQVLSTLGMNLTSQSTADVITTLRKAVVDEWLGHNSKEYQSFLTYGQLETEACRFLNSQGKWEAW